MDMTLPAPSTSASLPRNAMPYPAQSQTPAAANSPPSLVERMLQISALPTLPCRSDIRPRSSSPPRLQAAAEIMNLPTEVRLRLIPFLRPDNTMAAIRNVAWFRAACMQLHHEIPEPLPEGVLGAAEFNRLEDLKQVLVDLQQSGKDVVEEANCFGRLKKIKTYGSQNLDFTPLMAAAYLGNTSMARVLLDAGAEVDRAMPEGWTALMWAAQQGHTTTVRELLQTGAKVDVMSNDCTALIVAAQNGCTSTVKALLQAGARIDQAGRDGVNALMAATMRGNTATVQFLLEAGANPNLRNNYFDTALSLAVRLNQQEILTLLRSYGADRGTVAQRNRSVNRRFG